MSSPCLLSHSQEQSILRLCDPLLQLPLKESCWCYSVPSCGDMYIYIYTYDGMTHDCQCLNMCSTTICPGEEETCTMKSSSRASSGASFVDDS